ncbi:MAG: hypothetical protein K0S65_4296, partial [Labilithrix sp.]|nr:hypothetical protein [Labilithrix sp.]
MRAAFVASVVVLAGLAGCADLLGFEDFVAGVPAPPDGGGDSGAVEADFYVSPTGDDGNDGSRERPFRSLKQALARASIALGEPGTAPRRIAVCSGEYREPALHIEGAIDVRGGYDCELWMRPAAEVVAHGVSFQSGSKLVSTERGAGFVSLESRPSGSPRLDGFQIEARDVVSAVIVSDGDPVLTELSIVNASNPAPDAGLGPALVGVVLSASNATLEHCNISVPQRYGISDATQPSASGVVIERGAPAVRRNVILLTDVLGLCTGIVAERATDGELTENFIQITNCVKGAAIGGSVGIATLDSVTKSRRNSILINTPGAADPATAAIAVGVNARGSRAFESDGDRVLAPNGLHLERTPSALIFHGFQGDGALARIVNASVIVDSRGYAVEESTGIFLNAPKPAYLAHNSMYFSASGTPDGGRPPIRAIYLSDSAQEVDGGAVTVTANLVVSDDPRMGFVRASCCAPS